ncbi:MAG TPA: hypothetical protein VKU00_07315 [Chthonomonadaceae bacterium]|nr:hypothetical protein [Chthonomonadaceae bacterium]
MLCKPVVACSILLLVLCVWCHPLQAQSFSPLSLVDNPFLPSGDPFRIYSDLLPSFVGLGYDQAPYWAMGFNAMDTLETKQKGRDTGHLYGDIYSADLALRISRKVDFELHYQRINQTGYDAANNLKPIQVQSDANETEVRFIHHLGTHRIYWGWDFVETGVNAATNQLNDVLFVFSQTPVAMWNHDAAKGNIGLIYSISRKLSVDLRGSFVNLTGRAALLDEMTSVSIPTSANGWEQSAVIRANVDRRTEVTGLWEGARYTGVHDVLKNSTKLGDGSTTLTNSMWGFGVKRAFGNTGSLGLAFFSTLAKIDCHSYDLDPVLLGFSVDRVGYYLNGSFPHRSVSLNWRQQWSSNHGLSIGFQWIDIPINVQYGYTAASFLTGTSQGGSLDLTSSKGLLLRLLYTMPIKSLGLSFDIEQFVPVTSHSSGMSTHTDATSPQTSSGGLFWSIYLSEHF